MSFRIHSLHEQGDVLSKPLPSHQYCLIVPAPLVVAEQMFRPTKYLSHRCWFGGHFPSEWRPLSLAQTERERENPLSMPRAWRDRWVCGHWRDLPQPVGTSLCARRLQLEIAATTINIFLHPEPLSHLFYKSKRPLNCCRLWYLITCSHHPGSYFCWNRWTLYGWFGTRTYRVSNSCCCLVTCGQCTFFIG